MRDVWVAGVDGCRGGWFVVLQNTATGEFVTDVLTEFLEVVHHKLAPAITGVDIPIGLLDAARPGGRSPDKQARKLLGKRASSVFSPPVWDALFNSGDDPTEANRRNRSSSPANMGISLQAFGLFPKLREVHRVMTPELQECVKEVHPELSFMEMNAGSPIATTKKRLAGRRARLELLKRHGFADVESALLRHGNRTVVAPDDILDAFAALWSARRIIEGSAIRLPADPERDAQGLQMEIWR